MIQVKYWTQTPIFLSYVISSWHTYLCGNVVWPCEPNNYICCHKQGKIGKYKGNVAEFFMNLIS